MPHSKKDLRAAMDAIAQDSDPKDLEAFLEYERVAREYNRFGRFQFEFASTKAAIADERYVSLREYWGAKDEFEAEQAKLRNAYPNYMR